MSFLIYPREAITSSGGKGGDNRGNRRRPFRRRGYNNQENEHQGRHESMNRHDSINRDDSSNHDPVNHHDSMNRAESAIRGDSSKMHERPKWIPPKISNDPLPSPECPYCGKPIRDLASALCEKGTGKAVHFDCILGKLASEEILDKGEFVSYIGGGRFGIVRFNSTDNKKFTIKKILEWENKDERPDWRLVISENYSVT